MSSDGDVGDLLDVSAERGVLGAILYFPDKYFVAEDLGVRHFHFLDGFHGRLYAYVGDGLKAKKSITPRFLQAFADADVQFKDSAGSGFRYLMELVKEACCGSTFREESEVILQKYAYRGLRNIVSGISDRLSSVGSGGVFELVDWVESGATALRPENIISDSVVSLREACDDALDAIKKRAEIKGLSGLSTGFVELDKLLDGFNRSDLIILAARPSMGKTALALNMAYETSRTLANDETVLFLSLEMPTRQLVTRLLSAKSGVAVSSLRSAESLDFFFGKVREAAEEIKNSNLFFDDKSIKNVSELRARVRGFSMKYKLKCLFVDYLQLIDSDHRGRMKVYEVAEVTKSLKALAKELDIPVVVLSQLSRGVESREAKEPLLSDLRDSGSIEQDADVVMFVTRESYYLERSMPKEGTERYIEHVKRLDEVKDRATLLISKHRNGAIGKVDLGFSSETTRFYSI